jgi:hypothetical protein
MVRLPGLNSSGPCGQQIERTPSGTTRCAHNREVSEFGVAIRAQRKAEGPTLGSQIRQTQTKEQPMRLHPAISSDEALVWLERQVDDLQLASKPDDLDEALATTAQAMAAISRTVLPDELEPRFP